MPDYDVILRGGTLYDGSGEAPIIGDIALQGDTIAAIGNLSDKTAAQEIDVSGLAVAPGFINMLSWAVVSLIVDGKSQSDIRQGVTLEVVGEAISMGPVNEKSRPEMESMRGNMGAKLEWETLGEYLQFMEDRGISTNITSFVGASLLRMNTVGYDDRPATPEELEEMKQMVRQAMEEGAVGMSTALIYPPGAYASTEELTELCRVVAEYDGLYISHMRSEGDTIEEGLEEFLSIVRDANVRGEIYHLKIAGRDNWGKLDWLVEKVEAAQAEGYEVTADMYTYPAGSTGLRATIPPWVHDGGTEKLIERLKDPELREQIKIEMNTSTEGWENLYRAVGGPENILLVDFDSPEMQPYVGKTLAQVAEERGTKPEYTAMDLIIEDKGNVSAIYFMIDEANIRRQAQIPWVSICSDSPSLAPEGIFLKEHAHPRAYGSFARFLGYYAYQEGLVPVEEAIRRLAALPAEVLRIPRRGKLEEGFFADVVVFDPANVTAPATFENPAQYATGMEHVFVNGVQVIAEGEHTGAKPGRFVKGPGYTGD
ncbi:D-aminoacylase [Phototrophicus methaneseepsis]|uniref:D-aminoacylase n=1 Tax=Phototrophicus methaneseepsis TaxID=2710758 RepID=A0A7S8IGG8_9CHLR|nr:D-aminoacylase [Phototrophicus methaneseepsis]QPC84614.1 D-aminoacylase [Phototrophicus methaneseepsis]